MVAVLPGTWDRVPGCWRRAPNTPSWFVVLVTRSPLNFPEIKKEGVGLVWK